jgi:CHAT domain-containing protein/tetratricopeptide (TPR) repeat protein
MIRSRLAAAAVACSLAWPGGASAQSLGGFLRDLGTSLNNSVAPAAMTRQELIELQQRLKAMDAVLKRAQELERQGLYAKAELAWRELIGLHEQLSASTIGQSPSERADVMNLSAEGQRALAFNLYQQQRHDESVAQWRVALVSTRAWVQNAKTTNDSAKRQTVLGGALVNMSQALSHAGSQREAEATLRDATSVLERAYEVAPTSATAEVLAIVLYNTGTGLANGGRPADAEPLLSRALALREKALGDEHPLTQNTRMNLAAALSRLGRHAEAAALHRRLADAWQASKGPLHGDTVFALEQVATDIGRQGSLPGAEQVLRDVLARYKKMTPFDAGWYAGAQYALAHNLARQGRFSDALVLADAAAPAIAAAYGTGSPEASNALQLAGQAHLSTHDVPGAVQRLRTACQSFGDVERRRERVSAVEAEAAFSAERRSRCATLLSISLASWAAQGGGSAPTDTVPALQREAWLAVQDAQLSNAGTALSRSGARQVAQHAGAGDAADRYEQALSDVETAEREWAQAQRAGQVNTPAQRVALLRAADKARHLASEAADVLAARAPAYWDLRATRAVPVADLQRRGAAPLLGDDELLVVWLLSPDIQRGVVMALSAREMAIARITLDTAEVDRRVKRLREQIDPCAWGTSGADCRSPDSGGPRGFDTMMAWELHQALLGDPAIQRLVTNPAIKTLLFVPDGSLTSLPPGVLISKQPALNTPLAQQAWLLRDKAIAVLPTVAALRTVRQVMPRPEATTASVIVPLFMLADPDFSGMGERPAAFGGKRAVPSVATQYLVDGRGRADALARLPPLPGTEAEANLLRKVLQARDVDMLLGAQAREAVLRERRGALAQARVVAFATHGLVTGDLGSAEPGLALAAPRPAETQAGDDGVLSASEVAQFRLAANWVLLSACNTAAPGSQNAQGLSGLARAFFHAGARSLLVSHWRVEDEATQALITGTLQAQQGNPSISKAQALRQASLAVMRGDDLVRPGLDTAELNDLRVRRGHPAAWAAFTLVGEPR